MTDLRDDRVFDGAHLRAELAGPGPNGLFVTFDHWRKERMGFVETPPGKSALALGFASLRISTAANDWFLNADLDPLRKVLAEIVPAFPVVRAMGFSMGGYAALLLSQALHLDRVTLFAPQVAIRAEVVPFERRWRREAALVDPALDNLAGVIKPDLCGVAVFDPTYSRSERLHARAIQALAPGIIPAPMPFSGHPPTAVMMAARSFHLVQQATIAGTLTATDMLKLHRKGREGTEKYLNGMLRVMRKRGALDG
ncbi:MAG: hypothetical protein ACRCS3_04175 [Paracoccaceae bacterium]